MTTQLDQLNEYIMSDYPDMPLKTKMALIDVGLFIGPWHREILEDYITNLQAEIKRLRKENSSENR